MIDVNKFKSISIGIASDEKIRNWSYGEIKKPETINYRTLKPERDGLFCERIFGPLKDWECFCGKYRKIRYKGIICDKCGVEITSSNVRRERMGHIELASSVTHIWYFKGIPSRIAIILDLSPKILEEIIYFSSYIVIDSGNTDLEYKKVLNEIEYRNIIKKYGNEVEISIGAFAIKKLLMKIDLKKEIFKLKKELLICNIQKKVRLIKRLDILEAFLFSNNKLEWMIMNVLPVIPPDLRPMVQLEGGRFAASDLNDLYRRVINRNNRLKRLLKLNAPNIIIQNEKRMLQEAVDALIDNGRRGRPITGTGNRPLKSLSSMLKGKQGRFRQNLLGKRVDYSGRSVIVVGPTLKMYQCGIPKEMAIELFKPFIIHKLVKKNIAINIKNAKRKIENGDDEVWNILNKIIYKYPVLLNRAPTLHRLGIQAFEPILVEGRALKLHPLVCEAYNADFDGDQMAVHIPLSEKAKEEAIKLMLASKNILNPKDGKPVVTPSQDMILGNYYLTIEKKNCKGEGMIFSNSNEAILALNNEYIELHTKIGIIVKSFLNKKFTDFQKDKILITTVGKIIFNEIMPNKFPYLNEPSNYNLTIKTPDKYFIKCCDINIFEFIESQEIVLPFKKQDLGNIILEIFKCFGVEETSKMLDLMKDLGYKYSTISGITVGIDDITILKDKKKIIKESHNKVEIILDQFNKGLITKEERYENIIKIWNDTKDKIQFKLINNLNDENPIFMMAGSGARGSEANFTQLAGMRGLMAAPNGRIMELPVISNFREGLSVLEMFISTHGARKGMTDTALKTADSGYLTRRLVDVAQDIIIREKDCGTDKDLKIEEIFDGEEIIETLEERLLGRYTSRIIFDFNNKKIIDKNILIDEKILKKILDFKVKEIYIRSVLTCNTNHGVCCRCYGINLATGLKVCIGEAVGTIAAQSIGEPGTQLTMRTFHTGGVAGNDITQGLPRIQEIFEARSPRGKAIISEISGKVIKIIKNKNKFINEIYIKGKIEEKKYLISDLLILKIKKNDIVKRGDALTEGSIDPKELLKICDVLTVEKYLLSEVQRVYRMQGVEIGDKHIELIIRQMLCKVKIINSGDTGLLSGKLLDISDFLKKNKKIILNKKIPATCKIILLGITKASLETNSFLSAASFQETTRVLTDAAIRGKVDELLGLKENVIIGKIIPSGTGWKNK